METKQRASLLKKYLVSVVLVWNVLLTVLLGMGMIPKKDEIIATLQKEYDEAKKQYQGVVEKLKTLEQKVVSVLVENEKLANENKILKENNYAPVKLHHVKEPVKLRHSDSLRIANILKNEVISEEDSMNIYQDVVGKMLHKNIKPIRVR